MSNRTSHFLTLVFASLFLVSFGIISHNAFADTVTATIPVNGAYGVATNPNTGMIYVANGHSYSIQAINGATNAVVANVTTSSVPSGSQGCFTYAVAVNPSTNMVYTNNGACVYWPDSSFPHWISQSVTAINGTDNQVVAVISMPPTSDQSAPPQPIAVNPATNTVYAIFHREFPGLPASVGTYLEVINGTTNQIAASIAIPANYNCYGGCSDIAVDPDTNTVYVLDVGKIYVIDGSTNSIVDNFSWGKSSRFGIGVNPVTNQIYISNNDRSVSVIDGSTHRIAANIQVTTAGFVGMNTAANKIYTSSTGGGQVISVIDGNTNTASQLLVGSSPYGIGVDTAANKIYIGNSGNSTVSVIDGSTPVASVAPPAPGNMQSVSYDGEVKLSWAASVCNNCPVVTKYDIYRGATSGSEELLNHTRNPGFVDRAVTSNQAYFYYITAENFVGQSAGSGETYAMPTPPSVPYLLTATAGDQSVCLAYRLPVNYVAGTFLDQLVFYRKTLSGNWTTLYTKGDHLGSGYYCDSALTNGQAYHYKMTAVYGYGNGTYTESAPSNVVIGVPGEPTAAPGVPTGLAAATASPSQISLSWAAPVSNGNSAINYYKIYRSTSSGTEALFTVLANMTSYTDNTVARGQVYFYKVTAVNSAGESAQSSEASATPGSTETGGTASSIALDNVQSTSGTTDTSNQITLSSFNATAGNDRLLVVGVSANNNNVGSITFAGTPLTREVSHFTNNDAEFWYLTNPSGTGDITVTMNGPTQAVVGAYSFSGVNQTVPIPVHITRHNLSPSSPAISITTVSPNDWVLDLPSIWGGVTLGSPTCTQQWDLNVPDQITGASSSTMVPSPATVTCSWTASSDNMWDDAAIEIGAAG